MTGRLPLVGPSNGDLVADAQRAAGEQLAAARRWAAAHPDELAVAVIPAAALILTMNRHKLSWFEAALIAEGGYWLGVLACREYQRWKARPAPGWARTGKVSG
jgi:hypothetical protein